MVVSIMLMKDKTRLLQKKKDGFKSQLSQQLNPNLKYAEILKFILSVLFHNKWTKTIYFRIVRFPVFVKSSLSKQRPSM